MIWRNRHRAGRKKRPNSRNSKKLTFQLLREYKQGFISPQISFVDLKELICTKNIGIKTPRHPYDRSMIDLPTDIPPEYTFRPFLGSRISFPFLFPLGRLSTPRSSFSLFFPRPFWRQQVFRRDFSISWNSRQICKVLPLLNHTTSSLINTHTHKQKTKARNGVIFIICVR